MKNSNIGQQYSIIKKIAIKCIKNELDSWPCFGLISIKNNGSHTDMTYALMKKSILAFQSYFKAINKLVMNDETPNFIKLREIGQVHEQLMFHISGGINTYKGLIFCFGIIYFAVVYGIKKHMQFNNLPKFIKRFCASIITGDFHNRQMFKTKGMDLFKNHKISGARQLAIGGYKICFTKGQDFLKKIMAYNPRMSNNKICLYLLVFYLSKIQDTTLISKVGIKEFQTYQKQTKKWLKLLEKGEFKACYREILLVNEIWKNKNCSPGGCADLIVVTLFLRNIATFFKP